MNTFLRRSHVYCMSVFLLGIAFSQAGYASELDWVEDYAFDPNKQFQTAWSSYSYGDFRIGFECRQGRVRFLIEHERFLGLHNSAVDVTFTVKDKDPISTTLQVRPHNDRMAASIVHDPKPVAEYLMGANYVFVTIYPEYRNSMGNGFSMSGSDYTIYRVFEVCEDPLSVAKPKRPAALGPRLTSPEQARRLYEAEAERRAKAREEKEREHVRERLKGLFD